MSAASPWELKNAKRVARITKVAYSEALDALRAARLSTPRDDREDVSVRTERIVENACKALGVNA